MASNNNAHTLDTAGSPVVDYVWGNFPLQPNDQRTETAASNIGGSTGDTGWSATTQVTGARLEFAGIAKTLNNGITQTVPAGNHELDETAYSGYPSYTPAAGNYIVTAVSGDGTTVTYTSQNKLAAGDTVNITGLTASAYNLSSATVATADVLKFTVTNAANAGLITGQYGKVQSTTALTGSDGAYVSGVAYIDVPSILGLTTALGLDALKDAGFAAANITNTTGATNTATQPTGINVTTTSAATVTIAGGTGTWAVGTKVTIAAGTGIPTALVGTWSVTGGSGSTLVIAGSGWTVANTGAITPGTVLTGASGTVKSQSIAAAAASTALSATITMTSWA
jgi:hypothetical protein